MPAPDMSQFSSRDRHPTRDFAPKRLADSIKDLTLDKAKLLCKMIDGDEDPLQLPEVAKWHSKLHNRPSYSEACLEAALILLEGHSVEGITLDGEVYPDAAYVNLGDTYIATVLVELGRNRFMLTSYGDWIEANEKTSEE